jgi:3-deoxy-D-manno-octulosonic-acid transferase
MSINTFKLYCVYWLYESVKFALIVISWIFPHKKLRERKAFEKMNVLKDPNWVADYAVEFSSEGELEQLIPFIENALTQNKKIELVYSSPSVEHRVQDLVAKDTDSLRPFRICFVTAPLGSRRHICKQLSAKNMIFCRYDFFPDLIMCAYRKKMNLTLLWASLKKYHGQAKFWQKVVYALFHQVVAATQKDKKFLVRYLQEEVPLIDYDFRPSRIKSRLNSAHETLNSKIQNFSKLEEFLSLYPDEKRLIVGSGWADEFTEDGLDIKDQVLFIVPHSLSDHSINQLETKLKNIQEFPVVTISEKDSLDTFNQKLSDHRGAPQIIIWRYRGILTEMYSLFKFAYVGGGLRGSVHSLLEPAVAGCMVYSGQGIHRSTEADLITQYNPVQLFIVSSISEFLTNSHNAGKLNYDINFDKYISKMDKALRFIENGSS